MQYPDAYCVKCRKHTATEAKHTIVLQNTSRAVRGVCPECQTHVYKILPKNKILDRLVKSATPVLIEKKSLAKDFFLRLARPCMHWLRAAWQRLDQRFNSLRVATQWSIVVGSAAVCGFGVALLAVFFI